jgi:dienelactone hydrolase
MKKILRHSLAIFLLSGLFITLPGQIKSPAADLLVHRNRSGTIKTIRSERQWEKQRNRILENMQDVMGPLPAIAAKVSPEPEITEEFSKDGIIFRKIVFASEKDDRVPAYLMIPENISGPLPGILCLHQTIAAGKAEPAGLAGNPNLHYALELARRGYVTLAPDYPNFGDYSYDPYANGYQSTTMKGIWNHMAAVDLLQSLPEVDPGRIGCIGHSLGGHNTLFLAAFDKRIRAAVTSCGFNSFRKYYGGDLSGWSHKGYMPRIATVYDKNPDRMPFDFPEVLAAIAPRAVFISAPLHDSNFEVSGVCDCVNAAMPVYELLKAPGNIIMINPDAPHDFPYEARQAAYEFLDKKLKNGS